MPVEDLIEELLSEAEQDRRRIERRQQTLNALADMLRVSGANGASGTAPSTETVVVVAARLAYGFYHRHAAYVCQANRAFHKPGLTHLGFYADGKIQPEIPRIVARRHDVEWTRENAARLRSSGDATDAGLADVIESSLRSRERNEADRHDVFLLTPADDTSNTFVLPHPVEHDTSRHNFAAWTRKHRYVFLDALRSLPRTTDELEVAQHDIELRLRARQVV